VFAAALLHDFDECVGIEILEGLHGICKQLLERYAAPIVANARRSRCLSFLWLSAVTTIRSWHNAFREHLPVSKQNTRISFLHGDATLMDWSDASCVFANSTCFDEELMRKIARKADELRWVK
jgi:hypothetical protein